MSKKIANFTTAIFITGIVFSLNIGHLVKADAADNTGQSISTICNNGKCNTMICTNDQPCDVTSPKTSTNLNSSSTTTQPPSFVPFFGDGPAFDEYD
jgi:hypothetical protein